MKSISIAARQRFFAILAWFVFGFCTVFIITGFIVGSATPTEAQEVAAEEEVDPELEPAADTEANEQAAEEVETNEPTIEADEAQADTPTTDEEPANAEETDDDSPRGPPEEDQQDSEEDSAEEAPSEQAQIILGEMEGSGGTIPQKAISFLGIFFLLFIAFLMSNNRSKINWRLVTVGVALQLAFAILIFFVPGGQIIFDVATAAVTKLLEFTDNGSNFIFSSFVTQSWEPGLINFAFAVLPTIIFFSALMTILYHLGVMQKLVYFFALIMQKTMNLSGAESTSAAANIFVGQTEAPLVIKPFVEEMTESELMVVMTGGFATVAGGVLAIYVGMMDAVFPDIAGHLLAASVMSAPAALVVAKIIYPELGTPKTMGKLEISDKKEDVNVLDAASRGAAEGLKLALNVGAMLLAFIALIAMINYIITLPFLLWNQGSLSALADYFLANEMMIPEGCNPDGIAEAAVAGCVETMQAAAGAPERWIAPMITLQDILGYLFWPFAWIMGVPTQDCFLIAQLLGEKMVINELVAYSSLQQLLLDPEVVLQERSVIIATYALCGFANFGSIGIQLGGIGGIAPSRKQDLAKIALRAMIGGTLAAFMTATIAGILI